MQRKSALAFTYTFAHTGRRFSAYPTLRPFAPKCSARSALDRLHWVHVSQAGGQPAAFDHFESAAIAPAGRQTPSSPQASTTSPTLIRTGLDRLRLRRAVRLCGPGCGRTCVCVSSSSGVSGASPASQRGCVCFVRWRRGVLCQSAQAIEAAAECCGHGNKL
jgi:hypothetical protein